MKYKKVILNIKGGLGNQIFQIIAALNYCKKNNIYNLYINIPNLINYKVIRKLDIDLKLFEFSININLIKKRNIFLSKNFIYFFKYFNNMIIKIINEKSILKFDNSRIIILDGYFQTKQNLLLEDSLIDFSLQFDRVYSIYISSILFKLNIDFDNDYGLHIRGSDFLEHKELVNNNPLKLLNKLSIKKLFIFTDDKTYAISLLKDLDLDIIFITDYNLTDIQEFTLITKFKNMIITNSTFSLTASILNLHINKNIWCPTNWYYSKMKNNELLDIINHYKFNTY